MQSLFVIFVALLPITACGFGEAPLSTPKTVVLPSEEVLQVPVSAAQATPEPGLDWDSVYVSDLIEELAPPPLSHFAERSRADRKRFSYILDADLKADRSRVRNMQSRLRLRPGDVDLRFSLGDFYYQNGLPHLAEVEFLTLLEQDSRHGQAHKLLTDIYLQSGSVGRSTYHARRAHRELPDDASVMFIWAWTLRDGGDIQTAVEVAEAGLALAPEDVGVLVMLARLRIDEDRYEEAATLAGAAMEASPDHLRGHAVLAQALAALGREEEANHELVVHRRLLILNSANMLGSSPAMPEHERAAALASYHMHVGNINQAEIEIARSFQLVPGNPAAQVIQGRLQDKQGLGNEAKVTFEGILAEHPDHLMAQRALTTLLALSTVPGVRDFERASHMGNQLIRIGGGRDLEVLIALGTAEAGLGQTENARRHFEMACSIEPGNPLVAAALEKLP